MPSSGTLSIIVPLLNEYAVLTEFCRHLDATGADQLIIVDGGSSDGSWQWLRSDWQDGGRKITLQAGAGRANQMLAGARIASSDYFLFLHADSRLPSDAKHLITGLAELNKCWGRFDIEFDSPLRAMSTIAWFMNHRSCLTGIATGDQGIFMSRAVYEKVGGFDHLPLMEDIAMCKKLKAVAAPLCVDSVLRTSARRWEQRGWLRTIMLMWCFRLAYFLGVPAHRLASYYAHVR